MTTADRLRKQGIKEGMAKGLAKGQAATLLRLLRRKFGPLPDDVVARIRSATRADLDRYADRVLTAKTLGEVLAAS